MDRSAVDLTKSHYDRHVADVGESQGHAEKRRREGRAYPLKRFHNDVKKALIERSRNCSRDWNRCGQESAGRSGVYVLALLTSVPTALNLLAPERQGVRLRSEIALGLQEEPEGQGSAGCCGIDVVADAGNNRSSDEFSKFAADADKLYDLACGRGGDLWKWLGAGVRFVKGVDLSPREIEEAQRRFQDVKDSQRGEQLSAHFEQTDLLGQKVWMEAEAPFDAVSCMFAVHYFFHSEDALKMVLQHVSLNLRDGGYFFGTVPDGKRVMALLQGSMHTHAFRSEMLVVTAKWKGAAEPFGSAYTCSIADTVTEGHGEELGSLEYLVFQSVFTSLARKYGLVPVQDYGRGPWQHMLGDAEPGKLFRHLRPRFVQQHGSDSSLEEASKLNATFVFKKMASTAPAPPAVVAGKHQNGQGAAAGDV